jgi:glutamine amidotransferase
VTRFELPAALKIPHMGWNQLHTCTDSPLLNSIRRDAWFYFVHSYYVQPDDDSWTAATTDYGGEFVSIVARDNVFATQFHPEKSQIAGLQLLRNFVDL